MRKIKMTSFQNWVRESESAIKPIMDKEIKRCNGLIPEGVEEKLIQSYLTYKMVRVTWFLAISSIILSMISIIISLILSLR
jgi:hypothetical protein